MKAKRLYFDCCAFWNRMGVQKEDNIIALALADLQFCGKKDFMIEAWESHYKGVAEQAIAEIIQPKYNERRGEEGFLSDSGL